MVACASCLSIIYKTAQTLLKKLAIAVSVLLEKTAGHVWVSIRQVRFKGSQSLLSSAESIGRYLRSLAGVLIGY